VSATIPTSRRRPKVLSVIGARPEIIQASRVSAALAPLADEVLVHTGQHYDPSMSELQILSAKLPNPDYNLEVGSRPDAEQLAVGEERLSTLIERERPNAVLVRGDTNGTLSGARAAAAAGITLVHVEAGLRSFRAGMPEERNRVETDHLSDLLFPPTERAAARLRSEGVKGTIHVTGDPLCDMLESLRDEVQPASGDYVLATVHRDYNTSDPDRLGAVLECLGRSPWPVVFPVHPRTASCIGSWGLELPAHVRVSEPVSYRQMLQLERGARAIATDSGGVQREAYLWGVPCITLREETEWMETVEAGWNVLVGVDADAFAEALRRPIPAERPALFGDGHAAERIAGLTVEYLLDKLEEAA
jgi:UDP-N-acetylglucosamine 2-epimerase